jgi:hypothetical protein
MSRLKMKGELKMSTIKKGRVWYGEIQGRRPRISVALAIQTLGPCPNDFGIGIHLMKVSVWQFTSITAREGALVQYSNGAGRF